MTKYITEWKEIMKRFQNFLFMLLLVVVHTQPTVFFTHSGNQVACTYFNTTLDDLVTFYVLAKNADVPCDIISLDDSCRNELIENGVLRITSDYPCERVTGNDTVSCQFNMTKVCEICCRLNIQPYCYSTSPTMATDIMTTTGSLTTLATSDQGLIANATMDDLTDSERGASTDGPVVAAVSASATVIIIIVGLVVLLVLIWRCTHCVCLRSGLSPADESSVGLQGLDELASISLDKSQVEESTTNESPVAEESSTDRRNCGLPRHSITRDFSKSEQKKDGILDNQSCHHFTNELHPRNDESQSGKCFMDESGELQDTDSLGERRDLQHVAVPSQTQIVEPEVPQNKTKTSIEETGAGVTQSVFIQTPKPEILLVNGSMVPYSLSTPQGLIISENQ